MHCPLLQESSLAAYCNQFPGPCTALPGGASRGLPGRGVPTGTGWLLPGLQKGTVDSCQTECVVGWSNPRLWQTSEVSLWEPLASFRCECGVSGCLRGVGGSWEVLPSCFMAEPGPVLGRQPAVPCLWPPLCVSHHLQVAFICFNLAGVGSSWEYCHRLVLPSTVALRSVRRGGGVQSASQ